MIIRTNPGNPGPRGNPALFRNFGGRGGRQGNRGGVTINIFTGAAGLLGRVGGFLNRFNPFGGGGGSDPFAWLNRVRGSFGGGNPFGGMFGGGNPFGGFFGGGNPFGGFNPMAGGPMAAGGPFAGGGPLAAPVRDEIPVADLTLERLRASITGGRNPGFPAINAGNFVAALDRLTAGDPPRFEIPDPIPEAMANDDARPQWLRGYANADQRRNACQYLLNMTDAILRAMPAGHERRAATVQLRDNLLVIQRLQV